MELYDRIQAAVKYIQSSCTLEAEVAIVLGTGLGDLADHVEDATIIPYKDIPHFPKSTVESHKGRLVAGHMGRTPVFVVQGRFHYYEGYGMDDVTFPVRVLKMLGCKDLILTNAAGGINPKYEVGDLVLIEDHINLQPINPLRGIRDERLGDRFPEIKDAYSDELCSDLKEAAEQLGIKLQHGTYVCVQGPSLETQAELRWFRSMGADLVGMSTVPEVIVARQCGMSVAAISVVTNSTDENLVTAPTTLEEVIEAAEGAANVISQLVKKVLEG